MDRSLSAGVIIAFMLTLLLTGCHALFSPEKHTGDSGDRDYPRTLVPLQPAELEQLQESFNRLNDGKILTRLNPYGLTGEVDHGSARRANPGIPVTEPEAAQLAVRAVLRNAQFTNAADSLYLVNHIQDIRLVRDDSTEWLVRFEGQRYQGYPVRDTRISVWTYGDGAWAIRGFWYADLVLPEYPVIGEAEARWRVIGKRLVWHGFGGEPHEFLVTPADIGAPIEAVVMPLETGESIELRVTWKIPVIFESFIGWHCYVDVITGELLEIVQEFRT